MLTLMTVTKENKHDFRVEIAHIDNKGRVVHFFTNVKYGATCRMSDRDYLMKETIALGLNRMEN